jgi:hypothetical protein
MLQTFGIKAWDECFTETTQHHAIHHLENGQILYFPQLTFTLTPKEQIFLSPEFADPRAKNISYQSDAKKLWGVQHLTDSQHEQLKSLLHRFCEQACGLVKTILPYYSHQLIVARTSYRPVQISGRKTSVRKDDKRLHVDAFPSAPNQGKRILRVFSNVNPCGEDRVWRVGESFAEVVRRFLPLCRKPLPGVSRILHFLKITKSYRTLYDHYMLQIHDLMKRDDDYQANAKQREIRFPSGSTWIVQTDDVSHAAMLGQYVLEQTFYLPMTAMQDESKAPLRVLENIMNQKL